MLSFLYNLIPCKERCSLCHQPITRLKWGGRLHTTKRGSQYLHPIDYVVTSPFHSDIDKTAAIDKLEQTARAVYENT